MRGSYIASDHYTVVSVSRLAVIWEKVTDNLFMLYSRVMIE